MIHIFIYMCITHILNKTSTHFEQDIKIWLRNQIQALTCLYFHIVSFISGLHHTVKNNNIETIIKKILSKQLKIMKDAEIQEDTNLLFHLYTWFSKPTTWYGHYLPLKTKGKHINLLVKYITSSSCNKMHIYINT